MNQTAWIDFKNPRFFHLYIFQIAFTISNQNFAFKPEGSWYQVHLTETQ